MLTTSRHSLLTLLLVVLGAAAPVRGAEPVDPAHLQQTRVGHTILIRKVERPALIERLAQTADPVELEPREVALLSAYLTANSRPRRLPRDHYYSDRHAYRGTQFEDPENQLLTASPNVRADEWQRLRTHLLFNRELLALRADGAERR